MTSPAPMRSPYRTIPESNILVPPDIAQAVNFLIALAGALGCLPCPKCGDTGVIPMASTYIKFYYCDCAAGDAAAWAELEDEARSNRAAIAELAIG